MLRKQFVKFSAWAGILAIVLQVSIEFYAASIQPDYDPMAQTISALGSLNSPTYTLMFFWSCGFTLLLLFFAFGFIRFFSGRFRLSKLAGILIIIYAIGQGVLAGVFPMDPKTVQVSFTHLLHDGFSGLGDMALVAFPLVMLYFFKNSQKRFTLLCAVSGVVFLTLFLLAKFKLVEACIPYKGLFQRLFQWVYFCYLGFVCWYMLVKAKLVSSRD